jgi:hypothetical protein
MRRIAILATAIRQHHFEILGEGLKIILVLNFLLDRKPAASN